MTQKNIQIGIDPTGSRTGAREVNASLDSIKKKARAAVASVGSAATKAKKAVFSVKGALVAAGIVAALTSIIKTTSNFESAISDLSAITGATGKDLLFLSATAKEFGASTTLSASQAAEAFKLVASAKPSLLENKEALAAVTREAITLAEASGSTLPDAARTLGSALNQFGVEADEAGRFINVLAAGAKFGASEITDTAAALQKAGSVASSAGIGFETMNSAIQTLATISLKGAEAGTALRGVILKLTTQTNDQFNPAIVGLNMAFKNLSVAKLNDIQQSKLFGQEGITAAKVLIKQSAELEKLEGRLTGTSTAYEQARVKVDNLEGSWKQFQSAVESVTISLTEDLIPAMRTVVDMATRLLNSFSEDERALKLFNEQLVTNAHTMRQYGFELDDIDSSNLWEVNNAIHAMKLNGIDLIKNAPFSQLGEQLAPLVTRANNLRRGIEALAKSGTDSVNPAFVIMNENLATTEDRISAVTIKMAALSEQQEKLKDTEAASETKAVDTAALERELELIQSLRTPMQEFNDLIAGANARWLAGGLTVEEYTIAVMRAAESTKALSTSFDTDAFTTQLDIKTQAINDSLLTTEQLEVESYERKLFAAEDHFQQVGTGFQQHQSYVEALSKQHEANKTKLEKEGAAQRIRARASEVALASGVFSSLASLAGSSTKKQFELQQKLQRASVVASTAAGIMRAYADLGPIAGSAAAAAIGLAGAAQLVNINRNTFGGAGGTPQAGGSPNAPTPNTPILPLDTDRAQGRQVSEIKVEIFVQGSVVATDLVQLIAQGVETAVDTDHLRIEIQGEPANVSAIQ